jgi:hypothetical protein
MNVLAEHWVFKSILLSGAGEEKQALWRLPF